MEDFVILLIKIVVIFFGVTLHLASICTWIERKGSALIQDRIGANRAGRYMSFAKVKSPLLRIPLQLLHLFVLKPLGMLGVINTLVCDAMKAITKEDFIPEGVSNFMHSLAPFLAVFPIFLAYALVPIAPDFTAFGYPIRAQIATLDAGVLFIFAMGSVAVYGVALAGWTGNNKFSMLGALRASAQMISYELALGLALLAMVISFGTLDLYKMIQAQEDLWGVFQQPLAFVILYVVGMAETKRGPFDLPEAESELAAGYFTEYSGMKFLLFWLGEFAEIALFGLLVTIIFFGGWDLPGVALTRDGIFGFAAGHWVVALVGHVVLMLKVMFFSLLQIVIRWTLPRFRYDQLMDLGWKVFLPLALVNVLISAAGVLLKSPYLPAWGGLVIFILLGVGSALRQPVGTSVKRV